MASTATASPQGAPPGHAVGEIIFRYACATAATVLLAALAGVVVSLFIGGLPAFREFGLSFLTSTTWNPVTGCTEISAGCDHHNRPVELRRCLE